MGENGCWRMFANIIDGMVLAFAVFAATLVRADYCQARPNSRF